MNIDKELDNLIPLNESGNGFGCPEAAAEHDRKIQLLMHRQSAQRETKLFWIAVISALSSLVSASAAVIAVMNT